MQKARRNPVGRRPLVGNWFQVLFHSPVRGSFHLSLTVLCAIGLSGVFSLTGWSRLIRPGFLVSGGTQDNTRLLSYSHTGVSPSLPHTSICFRSNSSCHVVVLQPRLVLKPIGLGYSPFARHYLGNHYCFLFLPLIRCFSSRRSLSFTLCQTFSLTGCPIRISLDQGSFAPPQSFSQLITSFFASESQGIRLLPFPTSFFLFRTLFAKLLTA